VSFDKPQAGALPTLGLVIHPYKSVAGSIATARSWAQANGARIVARERDRDRITEALGHELPAFAVVTDGEFVRMVDGVLALGGDGTMMGAMRLVIDRPVPVLGVNHGNLGFLVEVTPSELDRSLAQLVSGEFTVEARDCLAAESPGKELATRFGFNDVVLARLGRTGAVSVDLRVNGQQYGYYKCDALVISTASGSTAYNHAAGGPVLSPSAAATVITPVAPMAGIGRSVVLGAGDEICLHVAPESAPVAVDIDGTAAGELGHDDTITTVLRKDAAQIVRFSAGAHASRSRVKLSLLDLPLRRDQLLDLIPEKARDRLTREAG
jgi:NAD+ kinase